MLSRRPWERLGDLGGASESFERFGGPKIDENGDRISDGSSGPKFGRYFGPKVAHVRVGSAQVRVGRAQVRGESAQEVGAGGRGGDPGTRKILENQTMDLGDRKSVV